MSETGEIQPVVERRLVRLLDIRPEHWPDLMPEGTQFRDLETGEWIEDYAGWERVRAMEDLAHPDDPHGTMSLRIPWDFSQTNVEPTDRHEKE